MSLIRAVLAVFFATIGFQAFAEKFDFSSSIAEGADKDEMVIVNGM